MALLNPKPGQRLGGRQKGTPNKVTGNLREAILLAAEAVGYDKKGKDGLPGYLKKVAEKDIKSFTSLLGRVLPLQVQGDPSAPLSHTHKVTIELVSAKQS